MPELRFAAPVEERVALVTGGAKGLGRAPARPVLGQHGFGPR